MESDRFYLFVYGSLMQDGCNHHLLAGQAYLGPVRTQPRYRLVDLGVYPGLIESADCGLSLHGELYSVENHLLPCLDALEDAPRLYQLLPIALEDVAVPVQAYFYRKNWQGFALYPGPRWDNHRR